MNDIILKNGYRMPLMGFGTWKLDGQSASIAVQTALDLGYRHVDTAAMYGNEMQVGKAIRKSMIAREEIFITSKVWPHNFHRPDFIRSVEKSLYKLGTDYIDLILLHWPNESIPLQEPLDALSELIADGRVRSGGVSNFNATDLQAALSYAPDAVCVNQIKMAYPAVSPDVASLAQHHNIALTAHSPLNAGKLRSDSLVQRLANEYTKTPAQIMLRWLTQQGVAAIPKSSSFERMNENLASLDFTLKDSDLRLLGTIFLKA